MWFWFFIHHCDHCVNIGSLWDPVVQKQQFTPGFFHGAVGTPNPIVCPQTLCEKGRRFLRLPLEHDIKQTGFVLHEMSCAIWPVRQPPQVVAVHLTL
jgi:hypothetical protein